MDNPEELATQEEENKTKTQDNMWVDNLNKGFIKSISFSRYTCIHEYNIVLSVFVLLSIFRYSD
jgi:hypothetical protein